jgi:5-amino-6-(5-phosphoribosylamino)uracil reductase
MVSRSGNVPVIEGAVTVDGSDLAGVKAQYPRILCEGGPHLFSTLLEQGLVDEVALSLSGHVGGSRGLLGAPTDASLRPTHVHADEHGLYTLWSVT